MDKYAYLEGKLHLIEARIKDLECEAKVIKMALIDEVFSTSLPDTAYPPKGRYR